MRLFNRLFSIIIIALFCSSWAFGQLYSYKTPSGRLLITDRPIDKKGYELIARKRPRGAKSKSSRSSTSSKYQLSVGQIDTLVQPIAKSLHVDPDLVKAVIEVESSRNYKITSNKGAQGLMQLIPSTAIRFGVDDAYSPRDNIKGGTRYLRFLLGYFEGNVDYVLAAYNAGEYAVDQHGGVPPYKETKNYIKKIRKRYSKAKHSFDPSISYRSRLIKNSKKPSVRPAKKLAKSN